MSTSSIAPSAPPPWPPVPTTPASTVALASHQATGTAEKEIHLTA